MACSYSVTTVLNVNMANTGLKIRKIRVANKG